MSDLKPTEIIKESGDFVLKTIPTLDQSKSGYWKLMAIGLAGGLIYVGVSIGSKVEPEHLEKMLQHHQPDSGCRLYGDSVICD